MGVLPPPMKRPARSGPIEVQEAGSRMGLVSPIRGKQGSRLGFFSLIGLRVFLAARVAEHCGIEVA